MSYTVYKTCVHIIRFFSQSCSRVCMGCPIQTVIYMGFPQPVSESRFFGLLSGLGRAESREHSPSREHRGNVSYRLGKWECDHGLGLGFRFPVSLPIHFTCETASFLRYAALRKHIGSIPHDYFLRGAYLRNEAVSHVERDGESKL